MRLLNSRTKKIEVFLSPPPYVILSHRWRDEEVTLGDLSKPDVVNMRGFVKLSSACDIALSLEFDYLWMDTCCIDKTSSAELSEAINSMYMWYKQAALCIAYLDDLEGKDWEDKFDKSTWFSRGWTLQELIAPAEVLFVAQKWEVIGTRTSLAWHIELATKIEQNVLMTGNTDGICVAKKMSWAAKRETTRVEDQAYSLMGIFDVNMPTIYGEGPKAFIRLQEEILKKSDDQSIFAWGRAYRCCSSRSKTTHTRTGHPLRNYLVAPHFPSGNIGLLAPDPSRFVEGDKIGLLPPGRIEHALGTQFLDAEYTVTNHGIRIRLPMQPLRGAREVYVAYLGCGNADGSSVSIIYLRLQSGRQFSRICGAFGEPELLHVPLTDVVTSNLKDDYVYVQATEPEVWAQPLKATIDAQSVLNFCEGSGFALLAGGPFGSQSRGSKQLDPVYSMDIDTDQRKNNNISFFVLQSESTQVALLVVTTLDGHLADRHHKECVLVRAFILGRRNGYRAGQSTMEIYENWRQSDQRKAPASSCAAVALPGGREVLFTMRCLEQPDWMGPKREKCGKWKLSVTMLLGAIDPSISGSEDDDDEEEEGDDA